MTYFLKTTYPCLVKAGETEFEIDETDTVEICDESFLFVYPQDGSIPFYVNLQTCQESERVSFLMLDEKKFLLLEPMCPLKISTKKTLIFSGKKCEVCADSKKIAFESDSTKIEILRQTEGELVDIFKVKDFACVQFSDEFFAFSTKTNIISHLLGKVERQGENLALTQSCKDSDGRQRLATLRFGENLEVVEENFVRENRPKIKEMAPFKMLEGVKSKDFTFALSLLSDNLKEKIDAHKIHEFFGNFNQILPLTTTEFLTISPQAKNYVSFQLQNDKISDINIDKL